MGDMEVERVVSAAGEKAAILKLERMRSDRDRVRVKRKTLEAVLESARERLNCSVPGAVYKKKVMTTKLMISLRRLHLRLRVAAIMRLLRYFLANKVASFVAFQWRVLGKFLFFFVFFVWNIRLLSWKELNFVAKWKFPRSFGYSPTNLAILELLGLNSENSLEFVT